MCPNSPDLNPVDYPIWGPGSSELTTAGSLALLVVEAGASFMTTPANGGVIVDQNGGHMVPCKCHPTNPHLSSPK